MPPNRRVITDTPVPAALRRLNKPGVGPELIARWNKRAAEAHKLAREYRTALMAQLGKEGLKQYRAVKKRLAHASRSVRLRDSDALLSRIGVDRRGAQRLLDKYFVLLAELSDDWLPSGPLSVRLPRCSPWIEYRAPYQGEFFQHLLHSGSNVDGADVLESLDKVTGMIGSRVDSVVTEAGDDDAFSGSYYAAFRTMHTALEDGVLEIHLDLETRALHLWGKMTDEWGYSNGFSLQRVSAWIRVISASQPDESQFVTILPAQISSWGTDKRWDFHGTQAGVVTKYPFRTSTAYPRGTILFLETGVMNESQFDLNDTSLKMTAEGEFRLDRIHVRSCG